MSLFQPSCSLRSRKSKRTPARSDDRSLRTRSSPLEGCRGCSLCCGTFTPRSSVDRSSRLTSREESERVSELKSISGSTSLPAGMLASGAEGIKEAIQGFDDAYVGPCFIAGPITDGQAKK